MSNTHEHLEHAEHVAHHSSNPFDKKVAMTMAIVAATLAFVTLLSHRGHNHVLGLQSLLGTLKVQESNAWAQYQAKRLRQELSAQTITLLNYSPEKSGKLNEELERLKKVVNKYKEELKEISNTAKDFQKKAKDTEAEIEFSHHQTDRVDASHLGVELGLVLCSIAVLTKRKSFWFGGIAVTLLGLVVLVAAYTLMGHEPHSEGDNHPVDNHQITGTAHETPSKAKSH